MRYQIRHVNVKYGDFAVLSDVNFEIRDHEKIAVVGRNGGGKTTLLKLIAGDLEMDNATSDEEAQITMSGRQTIGFLRQISFEDETITAEEEIKKVFADVFACEKRMAELEAEMSGAGSANTDVGAREETGARDAEAADALFAEYDHLQKFMDARQGYHWKQNLDIMFRQFGFAIEDLQKPMGEFSGGQQTKIAFIKLLLSRPDIMLLDEPTNHLDLPTIEWLEGYLKDYDRAVVIVSHDRMFLDKVTTVTYEIEYHHIKRYPGNYSTFMKLKEEALAKQEKDYELQQAEIARLTAWIEKWKNTPTKVAATRSKRKVIEHMVKIEKPVRVDTKTFKAMFHPRLQSFSEVLYVKDLAIGYDEVLSTVSFRLMKGERLAIIGENGKGKSTLLKTLVGAIPPLDGRFRYGNNVEWAYFDQQQAVLDVEDPHQTILQNFWEAYPSLKNEEVRSALGAFLFSQEDVEKEMGALSGGEKVRLALCKVFFTRPNLLILDEPTNHMDIIGKEALEQMLRSFEGTVLYVSHDRYFIRETATGILEMGAAEVRQYQGSYTDYLVEKNKREQGIITENYSAGAAQNAGAADAASSTASGPQASAASTAHTRAGTDAPTLADVFDKKTYYNPGKIRSRLTNQLSKYEKQLSEAENRAQELQIQMADPELASDYEKLMELQQELDAAEHEQETLLERMMEAELELEELDNVDNA